MAQNENVDDIVSSVAFEQLKALKENVKLTTKEIVSLSKEAKKAFDGLGDAKTLLQLVEASRKAQESTDGMSRKLKALTEEQIKARMETKRLNDELKLKIQLDQAQEGSIAKAALQVKKWTQELRALNLETQKADADNLRRNIDEKNAWIKENVDALSAQRINIGNYPELMAQFANIKQELKEMAAAGLQDTTMFADMEGKLSEISKAMGPTSAQLTSLTQSMTLLAQAGKQDTKEFKDMQQQAMALRANIQYVKTAITGNTTATDLHTEAMHKSKQATFAVSQVLRELPSFAYSTSTGFLSISNNIMPLKDTIDQLKIKNEELIASGQKAIPVWKSLGLAVFSVNGLITLGVAAITILSARLAQSGQEAKVAKDRLKEYGDELVNFSDSLQAMRGNIAAEAKFESSKADSQLKIMRDMTLTLDQRFLAYKQLQSIAPNIFDDLDKEGFKTAENTQRMKDQLKTMNDYILLQVAISEGRQNQRKNLELIEQNADLIKIKAAEIEAEKEKLVRGEAFKQALSRKEVEKMFAGITGTEMPLLQRSFFKPQYELNKLLQERNGLLQTEQNFNSKLAELERSRAVLQGNTKDAKGKTPKDNTLKNENDLTREIYDEYIKRIQIAAEAQKVISDDESKSLEERLMAYRQYAELSFDAETVRGVEELEVINNNLRQIEQIERKSVNKRTQQEKDLVEKKAFFLQQKDTLNAEYDLKEVQHIEKTAKAIVEIQQDEVSKRLDGVKWLTANIDAQENQAQEVLVANLKKGTISYKQYVASKKQLEDKFRQERQIQTIEYLQLEIDSLSKQGVDTRRMQEALNAALKALYNADTQNYLNAQKEKERGRQGIAQAIQGAVQQSIQTNRDFVDAYYQRQIEHEESLIAKINERKQAEIDRINNTMQSEEKKQKQIQALNAQTAQQEKQINAEIRRLKRQQAIADRVAAVLSTVGNTAAGVARALKDYSWPYNLIVGGIVGGVGAAQVASIFAQPLPQYGDGIKNHPGGDAVLGDKGEKELVKEPGKDPYWSADVPTVYNLRPGTSVLPKRLISREQLIAHNMGFMTPRMLNSLGLNFINDYSRLENKLDENANRITEAINNKPVPSWHLSRSGMRTIVRSGNSRTEYINQNFY